MISSFNPILLNLNYVMGYLYIDTRLKKNRLKIEDHFVPISNKAKENPCLTFKR